jgi:hypothetical protein
MMKKGFTLLLILFIAIPLLSTKKDWKAIETKVYPIKDAMDTPLTSKVYPAGHITTASPGDSVGTTWYDSQHNGTISKMIVNEAGGCDLQYVWMNGLDSLANSRHVYYNFGDPPTDPVGVQIDPGIITRSGYITMDAMSDGRAVAVYHAKLSTWSPTDWASAVSTDLIDCLGAFSFEWVDTVTLPPDENITAIWPHVAVDDSDFIHVVAHTAASPVGDPSPMYYSRSTDEGGSFSTWVLSEDSIYTISYDVQTSRQSGKVVISYCHVVPWNHRQFNQDIYYFESTDYGATWDFDNPNNVTSFTPNDTLRAYTDVSSIYDENDSLHLAFSLLNVEGDSMYYYASMIMHWSKETGMSVINSDTLIGWHSEYDAGHFRLMADRPSLGIDPTTGFLYCIFVGNPPGDTSAERWPNAELFATCSENGGLDWSPAVNLTNTSSIGCTPGNCEDDDYPSLAEIVDDDLHILYVNDKDAGGIPHDEGSWTLNPVLHLKVPKTILPCGVGVEEEKEEGFPGSFSLTQNVPNPFEKGTIIAYTLPQKSHVSLKVYDLTGREVKSLIGGEMSAGYHSLRWDGKDEAGKKVSSGIYFYRLNARGRETRPYTQTRKMIILR